jgi:hypothetical protein
LARSDSNKTRGDCNDGTYNNHKKHEENVARTTDGAHGDKANTTTSENSREDAIKRDVLESGSVGAARDDIVLDFGKEIAEASTDDIADIDG